MKLAFRSTFALAALAASSFAASADAPSFAAPHHDAPTASGSPSGKAAGATATAGTPMANAYRSYPPSCASYPLPDKPSGPTYSAPLSTYASTSNGYATTETLTVTVWRIACSSSGAAVPYNTGGAKNAMTLVRFDRADDTVTSVVPLRPRAFITQGNTTYGIVRVAAEPNTVASETSYGVPMQKSGTYVLENYVGASPRYDFLGAFKLTIVGGVGNVDISVPAYAPTADTYPDAFKPMALDGYAAAQYYNPERNEGLIVQVAEGYSSANPTHRQLAFDLLTTDAAGQPFWIVGSAAFDPVPGGIRSLDIPVSYLIENNAIKDWGRVHLVMTHCNELNVTFTPNTDLPEGVPSISGPISYTRLLSANGMMCE